MWPCPFRLLSGLPCPVCGATRSTALALHGREAFWNFNPLWPLYLLLLSGLGLFSLFRYRQRGEAWPGWLRRYWLPLLVFALLLAWVVGLAHREAILQ